MNDELYKSGNNCVLQLLKDSSKLFSSDLSFLVHS